MRTAIWSPFLSDHIQNKQELEEFVQSSGDHGIVVFSFGSMVNNLTMNRANMIASALGQIPQKESDPASVVRLQSSNTAYTKYTTSTPFDVSKGLFMH
ncbi:uncharacterized protein [Misgurnus anguillicaudatus]|uniref:uncharacterized protein isoform X4 n=1 Tax=Misgurnus anguillicaudatus TaxID=75329 RepID=UPI003CCF2D81